MSTSKRTTISATLLKGDVNKRIKQIPSNSVHCIVTSPPYFNLRKYGGSDSEIGFGSSLSGYIKEIENIGRELMRVLHPSGTMWFNIGDMYIERKDQSGKKISTLASIPWRIAFAFQKMGWILRQQIVWRKTSARPESVFNRPSCKFEYVFMFVKNSGYYFDNVMRLENGESKRSGVIRPASGVRLEDKAEGRVRSDRNLNAHYVGVNFGLVGRNITNVWDGAGGAEENKALLKGVHSASFPKYLPARCISLSCSSTVCSKCKYPYSRISRKLDGNDINYIQSLPEAKRFDARVKLLSVGWKPQCDCNAGTTQPTVFDPFCGTGTTLAAALEASCNGIGIELYDKIYNVAKKRLASYMCDGIMYTVKLIEK